MTTFLRRLVFLLIALGLGACASAPLVPKSGVNSFPGGWPFYSYGVSQSKENFANVERAQSAYPLYTGERTWVEIKPGRGAYIFMLQAYFPLHIRWQLKDGRQFIAENIDVRAAMREYFKMHEIALQHQREGRAWHPVGDSDPSFVHEVKNDEVNLKWLITINKTPIKDRLQPNGAANRWTFEYEEYVVATIKGTPTTGIDFDKRTELKK